MARVNGDDYTLNDGTTVAQLLTDLNVTGTRLAVEVNMEIIPKTQFETHTLQPDDVVEIVAFVGGG